MIEIHEVNGGLCYASNDMGELDDLAAYLEEIFPDALLGKIYRDKALGINLLPVDMGEDANKKDFADMLALYTRMKR